jgi:hypothetical protein
MASVNSATDTKSDYSRPIGTIIFIVLYVLMIVGFTRINDSMPVSDDGPVFSERLKTILGMNSLIVILVFFASMFFLGQGERSFVKYMIAITFFISLTAISIASMKQVSVKDT